MKRTYFIGASILVALVFILIAALLLRPQVSSGNLATTSAADRLYEAGHYEQAAQLYQQLAARGFEESYLFYNLGNAYYQNGQMAEALAAFEKAARLAPRDADIRANLLQTRQALGLPAESVRPGLLGQIANFSRSWLTGDEKAGLALVFWLSLGLLLVAWRGLSQESIRRIVRPAIAVVIVLVILLGMMLSSTLLVKEAPTAMPIPSHLVDTSITPGT